MSGCSKEVQSLPQHYVNKCSRDKQLAEAVISLFNNVKSTNGHQNHQEKSETTVLVKFVQYQFASK